MTDLREISDLAVGIDLGTTGVRLAAVDRERTTVASVHAPFPPGQRVGGCHTQDPGDWWQAVRVCFKALAGKTDIARVAAIAVDGTSGTIVPVNRRGEPLADALMYDDERAAAEAAFIGRHRSPGGIGHTAASPLAKALWWSRQSLKDVPFRVAHQADWIAGRLTGCFGVTDENNALKIGYDPVLRIWPDWIRTLGLPPSCLPDVRPVGSRLGPILPDLAEEWGLSTSCEVVLGTTDSIAAFLATDAQAVGDAATSLGTTLAIKMLVEKPVFDFETGVYSHRLGNRWLVGGASNVGGGVLLEHFTAQELESLSAQLDTEVPTGLAYYPLRRPGERFPINDPHLPPRLEPRPTDRRIFLQGIFEGLANVEKLAYDKLAQLSGREPAAIFSSGGAARNPAFARIRARILKRPLRPAADAEPSVGAARLALGALSP